MVPNLKWGDSRKQVHAGGQFGELVLGGRTAPELAWEGLKMTLLHQNWLGKVEDVISVPELAWEGRR